MPKVRLHRCRFTFIHSDLLDHCWRVQRALDDEGVDYEVVREATWPRSRRKDVISLSGQQYLPVIEFADGSVYREESNDMAETIRAGNLFEQAGASAAGG
jgi:glutathione S-transferase